MEIVIFLLIGATAGWIAGRVMEGGAFGLLGNVIVGVIGSVLGKFLAGKVGFGADAGIFTSLLIATIGAVILLFFVGIIKSLVVKK